MVFSYYVWTSNKLYHSDWRETNPLFLLRTIILIKISQSLILGLRAFAIALESKTLSVVKLQRNFHYFKSAILLFNLKRFNALCYISPFDIVRWSWKILSLQPFQWIKLSLSLHIWIALVHFIATSKFIIIALYSGSALPLSFFVSTNTIDNALSTEAIVIALLSQLINRFRL